MGALIRVNGLINSRLSVTALKIQVKSLLEVSPGELEMKFEETRRVDIVLRTALDESLTLELRSEHPEIARTSVSELTLAAGEVTTSFEVISGSSSAPRRKREV